jgi:hypothetical protein
MSLPATILRASTPHSDGVQVGEATTSKVAFRGATPIALPAGAAQAAAGVAAGANPTKAEFDTLVALTNAIRTALVDQGIIKGAA